MNRKYSYLIIFVFSIAAFLTSCAYKDRVQPIPLPNAENNAISIHGLQVAALSFMDPDAAEKAFGFNIRKAGLVPVQISFQNDGDQAARVLSEQTFLIDSKNQAWPINTLARTYDRIETYVEAGEAMSGAAKPALLMGAAGAVAGLAIGIIVNENIAEAMGKGAAIGAAAGAVAGGAEGYANAKDKIRTDLRAKSLSNRQILPNQIAYGVIFFPGFPEEAQDARLLKLTISFEGKVETVNLLLKDVKQ